jgi:hypothetical protein
MTIESTPYSDSPAFVSVKVAFLESLSLHLILYLDSPENQMIETFCSCRSAQIFLLRFFLHQRFHFKVRLDSEVQTQRFDTAFCRHFHIFLSPEMKWAVQISNETPYFESPW